MRKQREWRPLPSVEPGELRPCGSSPDGRHLEFFAHPDDVADLLANGATLIDALGGRRRFWASLSPTPYYGNGDVQVVLKEEAA